MNKIVLLILIIIFSISISLSEDVQFPVFNSVITFEHLPPEAPPPSRSFETDNYWVAFSNVMLNNLYTQLKSMNIDIKCFGKYPGGYVYHLNISDNFNSILSILRGNEFFVNIMPVEPADKVDEAIWTQTGLIYYDSIQQTIRAVIYFHQFLDPSEIENVTFGLTDSIIYTDTYEDYSFVDVIATCDNLIELADDDKIMKIVMWEPREYLTYFGRELAKVNEVQTNVFQPVVPPRTDWMVNTPYTGDSIWFNNSEYDNNPPFYQHLDLFEVDPTGPDTVFRDTSTVKTTWGSPAFGFGGVDGHGLMTAAIAIGNGWTSTLSSKFPTTELLRWRGIAPKAVVIPGSQTGDVNNRSFTEGLGGYYSTTSQSYDEMIRRHEGGRATFNNVHVASAANNGLIPPQYPPQGGYYSILTNSKNSICVGGIEKYGPELVMAAWSSMGPTRDGRIKPDIMAPGIGFARDKWYIEFDSIALVNNGTKYVWHFGPGDPTFGVYSDHNVYDRKQEGGLLKFTTYDRGWFFSDEMLPRTCTSSVNDTLIFRLRVEGVDHPQAQPIEFNLYWKRPSDTYAKGYPDYHIIVFDVPVNDQFYDLRVPIGDTDVVDYINGPWVNGDTIQNLRPAFRTKNWGLICSQPSLNTAVNEYYNTWGTSASAPFASGIVALMLQKYRDDVIRPFNISVGKDSLNIHDNPMWNSSVRGIMIHAATDMIDTVGIRGGPPNPEYLANGDSSVTVYGEGPDWATGWGFVNAKKALDYVDTTKFIERILNQGDSLSFFTYVPKGINSLRATLCWDDPEHRNATAGTAFETKLYNDFKNKPSFNYNCLGRRVDIPKIRKRNDYIAKGIYLAPYKQRIVILNNSAN